MISGTAAAVTQTTFNDATKGLGACFIAATVSSLIAATVTFWIRDDRAGLRCGGCLTCIDGEEEVDGGGGGHGEE